MGYSRSNTMFFISKWFLLYGFYYFSVECFIPVLNVQKLDSKLIERKRQDTREMCKIFTEENDRLERFKIRRNHVVHRNLLEKSRRVKRDLKHTNSSLDLVEAKRIETIVDRLYDDMAEHGEQVLYRQRNLSAAKAPILLQNQTARRFEFAPAILLPPLSSTAQTMIEETQVLSYEIPWQKHWKHGIVPYFIDPNTYDTHLSHIIIRAFDYFEKATCIRLQRLRERPTDKESLQNVEWLYITNPSGIRQCVHSNERKSNRGVQMVVFGYDCLSLGEVLHEIMHILGFSHEHTRPDRDQYLTVLWDNIKPAVYLKLPEVASTVFPVIPMATGELDGSDMLCLVYGYKKYFEIRTVDPLSSLPYDYSSVLHYPSRAFSKNGQVTLLVEAGIKVGQREGLSDNDIAKVTMIYSPQCMKRNKEYLLNTCPSVVKIQRDTSKNVTQDIIENYFKDRLWPYGIINYKMRDKMEFSTEERENLKAVIRHIEKETCIEFRDISMYDIEENTNNDNDKQDTHLNMNLDKEGVSDSNGNESDIQDVKDKIADPAKENITPTNSSDSNEQKMLYSMKQNFVAGSTEAGFEESEKSKETEENLIYRKKNTGEYTNTTKKHKKNVKGSSKLSYTFGSLSKASNPRNKILRTASTPGRRHAESTLTLVRSPEPGCRCPPSGRPKGDQVLKINADCFNSVNDLLHLFVHILGLDHQHNMHDRDSFLHILWDNLTPEVMKEMQHKLPPAAAVGFPYDYQSVMHYPWLQIKNGTSNIMYPIWNDGWAMGHWQGLSSTDVNKLNLIYFEQCSLRRAHTQE